MTKPIVSVIIPAYNAVRYIRETLDSVLAQTYPAFEAIIVDDGSTDDLETAVRPYRADQRIVFLRQENRGIAGARNAGVARASGAYIAFLDADDIALPERIAVQAAFLENHPQYGIVYSRFQSFYDGHPERFYSYRRRFYAGDIFRPLLHHSFICPSTVMMRRETFEVVGGFDKDFRDAEDWDLWRRLAYRGTYFGFLDKVLVHTRLRLKSLSGFHNQVRMKEMNLLSFEQMFNQMTAGERAAYRADAIIGTLRLKLAIAHLLLGNRAHFRFWLRKSGTVYRSLLAPLGWLPSSLVSNIIRKLWQMKQQRLFRVSSVRT